MYASASERPGVLALPGVVRRTLATTAGTMICEFTLDRGAVVPMHHHPHQQIGYVVTGRVRMTVDGEARVCGPGDAYAIEGNVPHMAEALETSVVVDVFTPQREDYAADLRGP